MKHLIIAALLATTAASTASAYDFAGGLSASSRSMVNQLVPGADVSGLTVAQISALELLFDNSDNLRSDNNPSGKVQMILARN